MFRLLVLSPGGNIQDGGDYRRIAGTSAQMAGEHFAHLGFSGFRHASEIIRARHQDARGAETALQCVMALKRLLQVAKRLVRRETFDGIHAPSFHLHGKHQARARRDSIYVDRACAAYTVLATNMRSGGAQFMPHEVRQQVARFAIPGAFASVECQHDLAVLAAIQLDW